MTKKHHLNFEVLDIETPIKKEDSERWEKLFKIVDDDDNCDSFLQLMEKEDQPPEVLFIAAALLSSAHWHPDNPHRGHGWCAMCALFQQEKSEDCGKDCGDCPLPDSDARCCHLPISHWMMWCRAWGREKGWIANRFFDVLFHMYQRSHAVYYAKQKRIAMKRSADFTQEEEDQ